MNSYLLRLLFLSFVIFSVSSCAVQKFVPEGKSLYKGATLEFSDGENIAEHSKLEESIKTSLYPKPNRKLLGLVYFNLWVYYAFDEINGGKFANWVNERFAEPPVYIEDIDVSLMEKIIQKELQDIGHFKSKIEGDPITKGNFSTLKYKIAASQLTLVKSIKRPSGETAIDSLISNYRRLQVKEGKPYKLIEFDIERNLLASHIRSRGYYDFNAEDIFYMVDTSNLKENVNILMRVQKPKEDSIYRKYHLRKINVYTTSGAFGSGAIENAKKSYVYNGLNIFEDFDYIDQKTLSRNILLNPKDLFSITDYNLTLNRLLNLNIFKYVNIQYEKFEADSLDVNILLTPTLYKGIQYDLEATTSDRSFLGSSVVFSFYNNNALRRAEKLSFSIRAGTELQYVNNLPKVAILNANMAIKYEVQRLLVPFNVPKLRSSVSPKTFLALDEDFQLWLQYFTMNSTNLNYGYKWQTDKQVNFVFEPIFFNLINVVRKTDEFEALLAERPILRLSYQDIFLIGSQFSTIYSSKRTERQRNHMSVRWTLETSGNTASAIERLTSGAGSTPNIGGVPISQYFKSDLELKLTRDFTTKLAWVSRVNIGLVNAYGNSEVAPFTKQFFIGGPSSLRGFEYRSVGPGTFKSTEETTSVNPIDQAGDIQLLFNTEYRFPLFSVFRGTFFIDAGNVWLFKADESRPGSGFKLDQFYKELALNTGFGLRMDIDYIALRLDFGIPLFSPFEDSGSKWIYERKVAGLFPWMKQYLVLSAGIGYPF